jgi:predicted metal-dependent peptidase
MFTAKLTANQRLQKAVIDIMANPRYVALSGVLMIGERKIVDTVPTACTDGKNEYYGREFVDSLNDKQLRFLVLHEVYHKLYRHLTTWRWMFDKNQQAANMATDFVINVKLCDENTDKFATMDGPLARGCYDEKYRGWDSAKVFQDLMDQAEEDGGGGSGQGQPGDDPQGFDEHDWAAAQEMSVEEQKELAREIDEAVRQGALAAGKMGSGGDRSFDDLLEAKVNWRDALREFVTATCTGSDYSTWRRPNRRYIGANIYMPSGISEQIGEIVIAPDMSGSTFTPSMMRAIMSEVKGLAETVNAEAIRVLYWDTEVCGDERYESHEIADLINTTKPEGGGGTMVECVPAYIAKNNIKAQAVIVLTDGYLGGSWGNWHQPVLWAVVDNKSAAPTVGKTLHIESHDL